MPGEPTPSDEQLIQRINAGDEAAFETLYRRHRDWVARLACRFCHDRDLALDVLQETFIYLLGKRPDLRLTGRMTTWLYPVVKHTAQAAARKRRRHTPGGSAGLPDRADGRRHPGAATDDALEALVNRLPEAQREVLLMRFVDQMSLAEVAAALDLPVGTVKSRLHLALGRLRDDPQTKKLLID